MTTGAAAQRMRPGTVAGAVGALGVVFGDIGTSPLYAVPAIFSPESPRPLVPDRATV